MAMSEFGKAFADARAKGKLKFDFGGKSYTTERKDEPRRTKYSTTADTAKFRAERDKPRTSMGQTGTRNFSSSPSSSKPEAEDGTRKALKDLSARTSPRELGKIPPRKYSAGEIQNMAAREADKKGSLANQYRKESRMRDLDATAAMMAAVAGAPAVSGAFKGATIPGLMEGAAGTVPGKIVTPAKEMGEKLSRRASDIYGAATGRGYKKGGNVKKYSGKEGSEVKKALGPREQADVKKMEDMQRKSKTPIGDIEPVPGHYGDKKYAKGGKVGESKAMVKKEVSFFKKKGAPKSMVKHEEKEAKGMKRGGGKVMKFAKGGSIDGCAVRGKTKLKRVKM
jgi:hypothetical protein